MNLSRFLKQQRETISKDFSHFEERSIESIENISHKSPLEAPVWLRTPELVCTFVDLADSTHLANHKDESVVAKVYMAFSQNLFEILDLFGAEYIDIRGDGGFALFEGSDAHNRALAASLVLAVLHDEIVRPLARKKFKLKLRAKIGIEHGNVLASRIGLRNLTREARNSMAWAGPLVNNAKLLSDIGKMVLKKKLGSRDGSSIVISNSFCELLAEDAEHRKHVFLACACSAPDPTLLWKSYLVPASKRKNLFYESVKYIGSSYCEEHISEFINVLKKKRPELKDRYLSLEQ